MDISPSSGGSTKINVDEKLHSVEDIFKGQAVTGKFYNTGVGTDIII